MGNYGVTFFTATNNSTGLGVPLTSQQVQDMVDLGNGNTTIDIRRQLQWKHIETSSNTSQTPTYDWTCLDADFDLCAATGGKVNLFLVIQGAPDGSAHQPHSSLNRLRIDASGNDVGYGGTGAIYASPADVAVFAQEVAARYNGTTTNALHGNAQTARLMTILQLGNEEYDTKALQVSMWQTGGRDDQGKRLGEMFIQVGPAVKNLHPTVKLGICAVRRVPTANYSRTHKVIWLQNFFNTVGSYATNLDWCDSHNYYQDPTRNGNDARAQDPSFDTPTGSVTPPHGQTWPYGADCPSIGTTVSDMLNVINTAGYGPNSSHPIQAWCCETGWALYDDGSRGNNGHGDPIVYLPASTVSAYYQTAADQVRNAGGSKIMYYTIDSSQALKDYSSPYYTHDVNGNPVTVTVWSTEKDSVILQQQQTGGSGTTRYQPFTDMQNTYIPAHPSWSSSPQPSNTGASSGDGLSLVGSSWLPPH